MVRHSKLKLSFLLVVAFWVMPAHRTGAQQARTTAPAQSDTGALQRKDHTPLGLAGSQIGNAPTSFVIGGKQAPEYRYVVGISFKDNGGAAICTGTLVARRLVLTAAHCGCGDSYRITQSLGMATDKYIPVTGRPILFDPFICQRSAILPGYDLALLRLAEDAVVEDAYQAYPPLAASIVGSLSIGTNLTVIGYGLTETQASGVRMEAVVPVYTPDCAHLQFVAAGCAPFLEMILAPNRGDGTRPTDTCSGDSGGPVFAMTAGVSGMVPTLVAVTSRPAPLPQIDLTNHCGGGGIYTVVGRTDVRNWLLQNGGAAGSLN